MAKNFKPIFLSVLVIASMRIAWADTVIVAIQGVRVAPYEQALNGFKSVCKADIRRFTLDEDNISPELIKKIDPALILAIGPGGSAYANHLPTIPHVSVMVLGNKGNRVCMTISPKRQINEVLKIVPQCSKIGLFYNPKNTGWIVEDIKKFVSKADIKLIAFEIDDPRDIPLKINGFYCGKDKIDLFWLLPDMTVVNPETIHFLFLTLLQNKIPILCFSPIYLKLGASISISVDPFDMGIQAGNMARHILLAPKEDRPKIPFEYAKKAVISVNTAILKKLGIPLKKTTLHTLETTHNRQFP